MFITVDMYFLRATAMLC